MVFNRVHRVRLAQHADPTTMQHNPVPNRLTYNVLLVCRVVLQTLIFLGNAAVSAHLSVCLVITAHPISTWCLIAILLVSTVFVVIVLQHAFNAATQPHAPIVFLRLF